eukprot:NODE_222_length_13951_cov_0.396982.p14 type:complete len:106 gc:universal NODE_222_length_13951_cov_0.396982:3858-3541(-)
MLNLSLLSVEAALVNSWIVFRNSSTLFFIPESCDFMSLNLTFTAPSTLDKSITKSAHSGNLVSIISSKKCSNVYLRDGNFDLVSESFNSDEIANPYAPAFCPVFI